MSDSHNPDISILASSILKRFEAAGKIIIPVETLQVVRTYHSGSTKSFLDLIIKHAHFLFMERTYHTDRDNCDGDNTKDVTFSFDIGGVLLSKRFE